MIRWNWSPADIAHVEKAYLTYGFDPRVRAWWLRLRARDVAL